MRPLRIVLTDTCVLLNLVFAKRLEILAKLQDFEFQVPEEVLSEILGPSERAAIAEAFDSGLLHKTSLAEPGDLTVFADLRQFLGMGEAACLALAGRRGALVASDEKRRFLREAEQRLGSGRVLNTPGLLLLAIRRGIITADETDEAKEVLERHRFRMSFSSFRGLI